MINSPVVRADTLKFREEGVRDVIKDVFLPWYNAYRFLMQNIEVQEKVSFLKSFILNLLCFYGVFGTNLVMQLIIFKSLLNQPLTLYRKRLGTLLHENN